jgi:tRNA(Ser,Leu) C12 N-acetylase TAN1
VVRIGERMALITSEASASTRLLVTARDLWRTRRTVRALRQAAPGARVLETGFRGIFLVEADGGDPLELARHVSRAAASRIGRVMAVQGEVVSGPEPVEGAVVAVARRHVGLRDTFCFRLHKRGIHGMAEDSRLLESRIGGAIWEALRERDGTVPRVDLTDPDVTISAELLGPRTYVCIRRRDWRSAQESAPSP